MSLPLAPRPFRKIAAPALLGLLALGACGSSSQVAELSPGLYALTTRAGSPAASARLGVDRARAFCGERRRAFEPVQTEIGSPEYRIAFRCPHRPEDLLGTAEPPAAAAVPASPAIPEIPGFRPLPALR